MEDHRGLVPNDINMEFSTGNDRLGIRAVVPSLHKSSTPRAQSLYDNSFKVKAAQLWNLLPKETKTLESLEAFKASLSTFMGKIVDEPPVTGYTTTDRNSMLDKSGPRIAPSGGLQMK